MGLDFYVCYTVWWCPEVLISELINYFNHLGYICILFGLYFRLKSDMQDQQNNSLVDPMGDCSQCLLNLIVFGMATPYLHNGVMEIEDEDKCEVSFKVIFGIKKSFQ